MPSTSEARDPDGWAGVSESDWAGLHHRVGTLEQMARVAEVGHAHMVEQIAEITVSQHRSGPRLDKLSADLADNTAMSRAILSDIKEVHDVVVTARTTGKFAKWLAPTLGSLAVAVALLKGWFHDLVGWLSK